MPFASPRFAGDPVLEACLAGTHRMMAGETGDAVRKVQQALIDLGYHIPEGPTGTFGSRTGAAVVSFKTAKGLVPNDPVVGPGTSRALDLDIVALDSRNSTPDPVPVVTRPYRVTIKRIKCHSTNDYTGSDDLYGVLGNNRFDIGSFTAGDDRELEISQLVPAGVVDLFFKERDVTGDNLIGQISLVNHVDYVHRMNVRGGGANYDVSYLVESV